MRYNELVELKFKDWNGQPFKALVINDESLTLYPLDEDRLSGKLEWILCTGYNYGKWITENGTRFSHAYPLVLNKKPKRRMTNRQLAMWLAKGNGERSGDRMLNSYQYHNYDKMKPNDLVDEEVFVRKWDSEEWIEPTVDLLEEC